MWEEEEEEDEEKKRKKKKNIYKIKGGVIIVFDDGRWMGGIYRGQRKRTTASTSTLRSLQLMVLYRMCVRVGQPASAR